MSIGLLFLVLSAVCFGIKFVGVNTGQFDMVAGGWMFLVIAAIAGAI